MKRAFKTILPVLLLATVSCQRDGFEQSYQSITGEELASYVSALASDSFMGRAPFTPGEKITSTYLAEQLAEIGFSPAFGESYFQEVPMVEVVSRLSGEVKISTPGKMFSLTAPDMVAITSPRVTDHISVKGSEMVFAGFGINAPEYGRNDFEGIDVKGKTIVVFVNDPGLYTGDPGFFKGSEMTWYGRWIYKFTEAAKQGAEGILIVHETLGAGYKWDIPRNSSITPNLFMDDGSGNANHALFTGWIHADAARELFAALGYDIDSLRLASCSNDSRGFDLGCSVSLDIDNSYRYNSSINVAGILEGTTRSDEVIVYTGHWDHFGVGEVQNGDSIFNGAIDNGTTMAMMFEIGEAFASLPERPGRSIMLLFPTAEEQGLLGSKYYAANPAIPIEKTVACINNDMVLAAGRMKDVMVTGYGQSELEDILAEAASGQDRYILPDPNPHTGMYFRSDHFSFAAAGVPSLFARGNCDSREHGREWMAAYEQDYLNTKYHKAADNYDPETYNFEGITEDAQLLFEVGYRVATSGIWPQWKEGSEFRSLR